ncbi:hypothetical protein XENOCAPTIV_019878, partial [Xenoophorus captivus]
GGAGRSSAISSIWPMLLVVGRGATKGSRNERTAENLNFFAAPAAAPFLFPSSFLLSFRYVSRKPFHFFSRKRQSATSRFSLYFFGAVYPVCGCHFMDES